MNIVHAVLALHALLNMYTTIGVIGDGRHFVFDCPHFQGLRQKHAQISQDSMRSLMWHKDQKPVLAIVNEAQTA